MPGFEIPPSRVAGNGGHINDTELVRQALIALDDHEHPISEVVGLQDALDGKSATGHTHAGYEATGTAAAAVDAHEDATNPHPGYVTDAALTAGLATKADVAALAAKVDTTDGRLSDARTPVAHSHSISDVSGLSAALDAKADDADIATLNDAVDAINSTLGVNPEGDESDVAARFLSVESRVSDLEADPGLVNAVVYMDFTGPGEPARPSVPAGVKVWWTGPFFPEAALVGDKIDLTA